MRKSMPLSTVKPIMTKAEALLVSSRFTTADETVAICAQALGFLARESKSYCNTLHYSKKFVPHFIEQVTGLVHLLDAPAPQEAKGFSLFGEVQSRSFAIVEDTALFIREKMLRAGAAVEHPLEEKVLSYFESSGNWLPRSGEQVIETYYTLLPVAVMHDMTATLKKLA